MPFDDATEFGKRISSVRGWMQMQRPEFGDFMGVSESTVWRWEEGNIGKKRGNPEGRRQFARDLQEKTGCPPEILGLTAPATEDDPRWQIVEERLNFLLQATRRYAGSQDAPDDFQKWFASDQRSGDIDL